MNKLTKGVRHFNIGTMIIDILRGKQTLLNTVN